MSKTIRSFRDTFTMSKRCLLISMRNIDTVLASIFMPALMMLLFTYVFGGAMNVGDTSYVNFIVPGILLQCIGQSSSTTAISVSNDMKIGIIDRFCTLPIKKSAILSGHVVSAVLRNYVTTIVIVLVAFVVGFRPSAQLFDWLLVAFIIFLYIIAISWISTFIGIKANSPEGAGAIAMFAAILPYVSSGFVPLDTLPGFLNVFARYQPMTPIIESLRMLILGEPLDMNTLFIAIAWCASLSILFYFLSARTFNKRK